MGFRRAGAALVLALAIAGCGGSTAGNGEDRERPARIVSLSPSATETLFALGAGGQVVAVDSESDYPPAAPRTDLTAYQPNVEAIVDYRPDLVVMPETVPDDARAGLRRVGLEVLLEPAPTTLEDAYDQMRELGRVTGRAAAGERLARQVRERVERLIAAAPRGRPLDVFHELDPDLFSASSQSFIGRIYARLGLRNIADAAARRSGNPYPQLASEAVVAADPDLIVLADSDCCGQTPATVGRRPGWSGIAAVRGGAVVAIGDDVASRWGPRIPTFVERVVEAMKVARR